MTDASAARDFYASAFSASPTASDRLTLDLHGTGALALRPLEALASETGTAPATEGFRRYVLSSIVSQPSEVEALLTAATARGAAVLKPAKRGFFGGFSAVHEAPDGAVWKLAAPTKKDTAPAATPPRPTESVAFLGVASPTASRAFSEALGMSVDRDYGDKFIDFALSPGSWRLGLMTSRALAGDAGVADGGHGFTAVVLTHVAASPDEVDSLLAAAATAGGRVTAEASATDDDYTGGFVDPDGHHWRLTTRELRTRR